MLPGYSPSGGPPPPPPRGGTLPGGALTPAATARLRAGLEAVAWELGAQGRKGGEEAVGMEDGPGGGDDDASPPPTTTTTAPPLPPLHAVDAALRSVAARILAGEAAAWAVGAGGAGRWAARVARAPARTLASGVRLEAWRGVAVAVAPPGPAPRPSAGGAAIAVEVGADAGGNPAAVCLPYVASTPRSDAPPSTRLALAPSSPDPELLLLRTAAAAAARHLDAVAASLGGEARFCALGGVARVEGGEAARAALTAPPAPPPAPPCLHVWVGGAERAPPLATLALLLHSGAHALATTAAHGGSGATTTHDAALPAPAPHLDAAARRAADADAAAGDRGGAAAAGVARALAAVVELAASAAAVAAAAHAAASRGLPVAAAPAALLAAALDAAGIADGDGGGADRVLVLALAPPPPLPAGVAASAAGAGAPAPRAFLLALPPRPDDPPGGDWKHALALSACDAHGVPTRLLSAAAVGGPHTAAPPPTPRAKKRARDGDSEEGGGVTAAVASARDAAGWGPSHVAALAAAAAAASAAAPWDAARHQLAAAGATLVDECTPGVPGGAPRVVVAGLPSLAALEARCRGGGGGVTPPPPPSPPPPRVELRPAARGAAWHLVIRSAYFAGLPATAGAAVVAEPAPADARRAAAAAAAAVRHDDAATHPPSPPVGIALEYRPGDGESPALALSDAVRCLRLHTLLVRCAELCGGGGAGGGGGRSNPPTQPFVWTVPGVGTVRLAAASAARALLVVVPPADGGGKRARGRGAAATEDASLFSSPPPLPPLAPDTASAPAQTLASPPVGVLLPSRADRGAALSRIRIEWEGDARAPPRARVAADPPLPAGAATALADAAEAGAEGAFLDGLAFAAFAAAAAADVGAGSGGNGASTLRVALALAALPSTYDVAAASAPGRPPLRARAVVAAGGVTWVGGGGPRVASALGGGGGSGGVWLSRRGELSDAIAKLAAAAAKG